jgi:hypothetical protein
MANHFQFPPPPGLLEKPLVISVTNSQNQDVVIRDVATKKIMQEIRTL